MFRALLAALLLACFMVGVTGCANAKYPKCSKQEECLQGEKCESGYCTK